MLPSSETSRQRRYHAPRVRRFASGRTNSSCSCSSGPTPSRERACEIPDLPLTRGGSDGGALLLREVDRRITRDES